MKQVIASRGRSWVGCVSLVGVVALASLAGCSSTPLPEQSAAGVEERDARPVERAVAVQEAPRVVGIVPPAMQADQ